MHQPTEVTPAARKAGRPCKKPNEKKRSKLSTRKKATISKTAVHHQDVPETEVCLERRKPGRPPKLKGQKTTTNLSSRKVSYIPKSKDIPKSKVTPIKCFLPSAEASHTSSHRSSIDLIDTPKCMDIDLRYDLYNLENLDSVFDGIIESLTDEESTGLSDVSCISKAAHGFDQLPGDPELPAGCDILHEDSEVSQEEITDYPNEPLYDSGPVLWLSTTPLDKPCPNSAGEDMDLDGSTAHEFYVVSDHVYQYNPSDEPEFGIATTKKTLHERLQLDVQSILSEAPFNKYTLLQGDSMQFIQHYDTSDGVGVKLNIKISDMGCATINVHGCTLSNEHDLWLNLPCIFTTLEDVSSRLWKVLEYKVCVGNYDEIFENLIPVSSGQSTVKTSEISAYREGNFCAVSGQHSYSSTIRSVRCDMLIKQGNRCKKCQLYRGTLRKKLSRQQQSQPQDPLSWKKPHSSQTREELISKVKSLKEYTKTLEYKLKYMERDLDRMMCEKGQMLPERDSEDMWLMVNEYGKEVENSYKDPTSYQRLFWEAQKKHNELKSKKSMRWHPSIIKWCIYMRAKSATAYDAMRRSGFIALPSERTIYDFTHAMPAKMGFQPEYVEHLIREAEAKGMYKEEWKGYVGLLQDEMHIKEDLVYDRVTGELVGYTDLDKYGSHIMELGKKGSQRPLAKSVLVIMVRGITTDLKYPLAAFATNGITADLLYPVLWKAVRIVEIDCGLKALFITCDGATPNRKFFNLHSQDQNDITYWTNNPYAVDQRKLYFISDAPHLLKTTRNCFANSGSHKQTRKLWNNKEIKWSHLVNLYVQHIEPHLYTHAYKLTRAHIDLTAFSQMKVSLAAQVFSRTVADALEYHYGDQVSETVKFIRHMNAFFDCLNTISNNEAITKRNPNVAEYRSVNDERLEYLQNNFLAYFSDWEAHVHNRYGHMSKSDRASMMLSYQTLNGLSITVKSVVECITLLLNAGAKYVLTHRFNQDPLEEHFSHHRHKGGGSNNPTINDVRHNINTLRVVGSHALAPLRGNVKGADINIHLTEEPMPRRQSKRRR